MGVWGYGGSYPVMVVVVIVRIFPMEDCITINSGK
jgi:hypothetical protein